MKLILRKSFVQLERTHQEMGREIGALRLKLAAAVIMKNPLAGRYVEDLSEMVELGADLGQALIDIAAEELGEERLAQVSAYGKAAVVGIEGELEHAAALMHPKFGAPIRKRLGKGPAIIPGTKKMGGPTDRVTAPLTNCDDIWSFDEMDAMEVFLPDGPRPDEIAMVLTLGIGGRPLKRI